MDNKHLKITHAYHFMSEAIVLFLLIHPVMYRHYQEVPYWGYLLLITGVCAIFTLYSVFGWNQLPYVLTTPVMILLFYIVGYPIGLSMVFAILLTWRYIAIRSEMHLKREEFYIIMAILMGSGIMFFIKDSEVLMLVFMLLIINVAGNIASHAAVIKKEDQKEFNRSFWISFIGVIVAVMLTSFLLSNVIQDLFHKAYNAMTIGLVNLISSTLGTLPDIDLDDFVDYGEGMIPEEQEIEKEILGESIFSEVAIVSIIYIGLTALAIGLGIIMIMKFIRTRVRFRLEEEGEESLYQQTERKLPRQKMFKRRSIRKQLKKIEHPVRKAIYQLEYDAAKHQKGRLPFETVEEWLLRIGFGTNLEVYQKVRYGEMEVSEKELQELMSDIKQMEMEIKT